MDSYYAKRGVTLYHGNCVDVLRELPEQSVHTCVTSPPYWGLRDYGNPDQLGLEPTPDLYVANMVEVFREVRRVLRDDGTLWLNLGDSYAGGGEKSQGRNDAGDDCGGGGNREGSGNPGRQGAIRVSHGLKPKDLCGIPWRVAFALQQDGWYLRSDIIWSKPNPMPEPVTDRPTKAHEYLFLLTKNARYFYDADAVREAAPNNKPRDRASNYKKAGECQGADSGKQAGHTMRGAAVIEPNPLGRNRRSVWTVATQPFSGAHFATMPPQLVRPCILAGCPKDGTVLDPFSGAATTALVARDHFRSAIGIELSEDYLQIAVDRLEGRIAAPVEESDPAQVELFG